MKTALRNKPPRRNERRERREQKRRSLGGLNLDVPTWLSESHPDQ